MGIAKVFFDVQANYGLPGLLALAHSKKFRFTGDNYEMFINRKRTKVSIMFNEQVVLRYSTTKEITVEELHEIPKLVKRGNWFDEKIDKAVAKWLDQEVTPIADFVKMAG